MDKLQKYKPTDKMIDLISDNYSLLQVMSRFGLSLGFGDKTVKEVCEMNGVDCTTYLTVVNFMTEGFPRLGDGTDTLSIPALVDYLRQAHLYFLDFCLPAIRRKLIEAIDCSENDVSFLILKFFDEYMREVRKHMEYEERTVFTYVDALLQGNVPKNYQPEFGISLCQKNSSNWSCFSISHLIAGFFGKKEYAINAAIIFIRKLVSPLCLECTAWAIFLSSSLIVSITDLLRSNILYLSVIGLFFMFDLSPVTQWIPSLNNVSKSVLEI